MLISCSIMLTNFVYSQQKLKNVKNNELKPCLGKKGSSIWIHIKDVTDEEIVFLKEKFNLHPTTIEDIFSQQTRAKYEEFEDHTVVIFKGISEIKENSIETYNLSLIIGENFLITVNGNKNEVIEDLCKNYKRVENLLKRGKCYIAHHILDKEVDKYLRIKTELGENLKQIEREFLEKQDKETLKKIFSIELNFLELRQLSESITDLCLNLSKPADNYINNDLIPYFRDIYDHAFKTTEGYKTMLGRMNGMKNMYASIASIKTNEVMRSLTIIMALMMPLTVITGFYGMNIPLPYQNNIYSQLYLFLLMFLSSILMIVLSRKKGWISRE